jgi:hypothetical protein
MQKYSTHTTLTTFLQLCPSRADAMVHGAVRPNGPGPPTWSGKTEPARATGPTTSR